MPGVPPISEALFEVEIVCRTFLCPRVCIICGAARSKHTEKARCFISLHSMCYSSRNKVAMRLTNCLRFYYFTIPVTLTPTLNKRNGKLGDQTSRRAIQAI